MPAKRFSLLRTALGTTVVLLALPLAGNLVSAEVHWSAADFFIAGCLFLSVSVGVLTIWRSLPQRKASHGLFYCSWYFLLFGRSCPLASLGHLLPDRNGMNWLK